MSSQATFGWDLLFKTIEPQKTFSEDEESTELLPDGWKDSPDKYALRYLFDKKLYILLATKSENIFIVNLLDVETKNVSNVGLDPDELVKALKGTLKTLIPTASEVMDRIRKELVDPVFAGTTKAVTTQTVIEEHRRDRRDDDYDPLRIPGPHRSSGIRGPIGSDPFGFPPVGIGSGDLDPLGRLGGGNLGILPRHGPQRGGARYDPFGPGPGVRRNPNNDEFQPPGFGDYYM